MGDGVSRVHKGQKVVPFTAHWSLTGNDAFQKYVCLDIAFVWPVPDYLSGEAAAQFVTNLFTSYSALQDLQVPKANTLSRLPQGRCWASKSSRWLSIGASRPSTWFAAQNRKQSSETWVPTR